MSLADIIMWDADRRRQQDVDTRERRVRLAGVIGTGLSNMFASLGKREEEEATLAKIRSQTMRNVSAANKDDTYEQSLQADVTRKNKEISDAAAYQEVLAKGLPLKETMQALRDKGIGDIILPHLKKMYETTKAENDAATSKLEKRDKLFGQLSSIAMGGLAEGGNPDQAWQQIVDIAKQGERGFDANEGTAGMSAKAKLTKIATMTKTGAAWVMKSAENSKFKSKDSLVALRLAMVEETDPEVLKEMEDLSKILQTNQDISNQVAVTKAALNEQKVTAEEISVTSYRAGMILGIEDMSKVVGMKVEYVSDINRIFKETDMSDKEVKEVIMSVYKYDSGGYFGSPSVSVIEGKTIEPFIDAYKQDKFLDEQTKAAVKSGQFAGWTIEDIRNFLKDKMEAAR